MVIARKLYQKHDECQRANGIKLIAFSFILIKLFIAKVSLLCQSSVEGHLVTFIAVIILRSRFLNENHL